MPWALLPVVLITLETIRLEPEEDSKRAPILLEENVEIVLFLIVPEELPV